MTRPAFLLHRRPIKHRPLCYRLDGPSEERVIRVASGYEEHRDGCTRQAPQGRSQGTCGQVARRGRLTLNTLLHRVINKANAIKCHMKQAAKEMAVQYNSECGHYEVRSLNKVKAKEALFNGQSSISLFSCDRNESRLIAARHVCACKTDLSNCHAAQGHRFDHWLEEQLQHSLIYIHANLCVPRKSQLAIHVAATSQCALWRVPTKLRGTNAVQGTHKENCCVLSSYRLSIQSSLVSSALCSTSHSSRIATISTLECRSSVSSAFGRPEDSINDQLPFLLWWKREATVCEAAIKSPRGRWRRNTASNCEPSLKRLA